MFNAVDFSERRSGEVIIIFLTLNVYTFLQYLHLSTINGLLLIAAFIKSSNIQINDFV